MPVQDSLELFRKIFDVNPDAVIVVDRDGIITHANEQVSKLFGHARGELIGRRVEMLVPERVAHRHVGHRQHYAASPSVRPMVLKSDLHGRRKDGSEFPVDVMLGPIEHDGDVQFLCVIRDLTERIRAEEKFRSLLEAAPDAMLIVDAVGTIVVVNSQAEHLFGFQRSAMLGQPVELLIPQRYRAGHAAHRQQFATNPRVRPMGVGLELHGRRSDGSEFPVEISLSPIQFEDETYSCAAIRDVTDRLLAGQALRDSLAEKEVLLKEIHHRVKNNLAIIANLLYLESTYIDDAAVQRILVDSQSRVQSMALVHEFLYRSSDLSAVDFGDYAHQLCAALLQAHGGETLRVRLITEVCSVSVGIDLAVPCGLILNELVSNALLHGFPGGRAGRVVVSVSQDGARCRIQVSDDGVGLPEAFSLDEAQTLGLRLVRILAQQARGDLDLVSGESGTSITLRVPLEAQP